ncbi:alpha/beta hydrolase [Rugamonas sp. DEMB1]|uniref:alpha/beta hydrolase n=1 Tax=Rugamonas sp. DEMB1 TaxID=3039386 RepID=UPI002446C7F1|nr:alpha/beta hydrolase [Rugamonas sp. DEMB1]WGG50078.1 alpha/beta hydrolase [Rugamonas sp. DEMB1]
MKRSACLLALCLTVLGADTIGIASAGAAPAPAALAVGAASEPAAPPPGSVMQVASRGTSVPVYAVWNEHAVATLVLFSGGNGGYGKIGADGWPSSQNFLIRSAKLFAAQPVNVVLVGLAPDLRELDGRARIGERHAQDNQAIFKMLKARSPAPLWLLGTSMGSISVASAAIRDSVVGDLAGIVLSSSVTAYRVEGAVPSQLLELIRVPVLVVHHQRDACKICAPHEAQYLAARLLNAPVKKVVLVDGGGQPSGDACGALDYHGYIGMEQQVVDLMTAWLRRPAD